ncbi:hypothetical protein HYPSUDRAFT_169359 [Hypholoma sublateritium FD-334 SS-4]|uniref:Uncharacterized protein n=1 Tax=Hypholoma sublateritium (strain FD-334 SS-4) TaxID=945553 RepID=A0A0D2NNC8_HYPSF|nr:hypothetical protein HYPSUDRAFT_169359 [Hypholoma sublateritium FD-334 SS-4]
MDYDRNDALLHWLFRQTQGDAWFRPNEENISSGVALRVTSTTATPEFRVFPYENASLEPFETAVAALNPVVAVKVRSAAVHAALAEVGPDEHAIYVDSETRIQILDTMLALPHADREQCAAFIRDERVMVIWAEALDRIVPLCQDVEERLIKLLWRARPSGPSTATSQTGQSPSLAHSHMSAYSTSAAGSLADHGVKGGATRRRWRRTWYGRKVPVREAGDVEVAVAGERRPVRLYAPLYNGLAAGIALVFVGNALRTLLMEWVLDGVFTRFALCAVIPLLFCVSLFFTLQIVQNVSMMAGPIAHYHTNSRYYSAVRPRVPQSLVDRQLPHVTIQMPVFKESLEAVLAPSIRSLKKAMQTYARQGGTSSLFVCDDGLRVLPPAARDERLAFYATHNIGWVARPPHDPSGSGFTRAGRFKKASNMNYALSLSLKMERHLEALIEAQRGTARSSGSAAPAAANTRAAGAPEGYGIQYQNRDGAESVVWGRDASGLSEDELEERALGLAIEEVWEESGRKWRPWAANGRATRVGEIVLIVDSDTVVPEDCIRDAAREMALSPEVAIIQHESDVMQVAHHYFENGIAYFTRRINRCISISCANGEVAPFMGHNAFLRWRAIQDAAFIDPADGKEKIWSESNVSEDFDMALRLMLKGYIVRWATYSKGQFKEGVSLSPDDELNRWQKYAFGCNELLFNPLVQWWRRGPITRQIHTFLWSPAPLHYKISMLSYMFSYYGIAASITISVINYVLLGFQFPVDGFFMHSFEIFLATTVVFWGSGTLGYTLLEYRLGQKKLFYAFFENLLWIPFFFFFFGGLSIPVSQAIFAHLFSYNIQWSATVKEVERSNFFKEIPKIVKRFWFPMGASILIMAGMIICATSIVPFVWRVDGSAWAVVLPLSMSVACHILFPIVLNPWLMVFSY